MPFSFRPTAPEVYFIVLIHFFKWATRYVTLMKSCEAVMKCMLRCRCVFIFRSVCEIRFILSVVQVGRAHYLCYPHRFKGVFFSFFCWYVFVVCSCNIYIYVRVCSPLPPRPNLPLCVPDFPPLSAPSPPTPPSIPLHIPVCHSTYEPFPTPSLYCANLLS